jgi:hypothetical protein
MRPGAERSFLHVEEPRLFAKSPISPVKWWRLPKLALGEKPRKWGDITWKKNLPIGDGAVAALSFTHSRALSSS